MCDKQEALCHDDVFLESLSQGLYHLLLGSVFEVRRADQCLDYLKTGSFNSILQMIEGSQCKFVCP